MMSLTSKNKVL